MRSGRSLPRVLATGLPSAVTLACGLALSLIGLVLLGYVGLLFYLGGGWETSFEGRPAWRLAVEGTLSTLVGGWWLVAAHRLWKSERWAWWSCLVAGAAVAAAPLRFIGIPGSSSVPPTDLWWAGAGFVVVVCLFAVRKDWNARTR